VTADDTAAPPAPSAPAPADPGQPTQPSVPDGSLGIGSLKGENRHE
jgi:hypothetical protein